MTVLFCFPHRPDHKTSVMARNAVVLFLPGKRIFDEKGKAAIDRGINGRWRRWGPIGQYKSSEAEKSQSCNECSHIAIGRADLASKNATVSINRARSVYRVHDAMFTGNRPF